MMLPGLNFTSVNITNSKDEICQFSARMLLTVQKEFAVLSERPHGPSLWPAQ